MAAANLPLLQELLKVIGKFELRFPGFQIHHPHPVPVGGRVDARAQRLGEGLLGGKALREVGDRLLVRAEALELGLAEDAPGKTLAEAVQHLLDASYLYEV